VLLQSEEELLAKRSSELVCEGAAPKPKKIIGKMKVQGNTYPGINIFTIKILVLSCPFISFVVQSVKLKQVSTLPVAVVFQLFQHQS
jgi:hypothetical protein